MVKFLVVGDLHGDMPEIHTTDFDAILAPGDFCGDNIRPYIKKWLKLRYKKEEEVDFDEVCPENVQKKEHKKSLRMGRKVLEKLNSYGKPVFLVPGNWDPTVYQDGENKKDVDEKDWPGLLEGLEYLKEVTHRKRSFKGITILGHGSTSAPEPMDKLELDPELEHFKEFRIYNKRIKFFKHAYERLAELNNKAKGPVILMSHNVPYDTKLDLVHNPGTYADGEHYGSKLARMFIDEFQPLLCVGGHIHEGHGKEMVGKTLCINAGFGGDVNTLVEIDEKKGTIIKVEFLGTNKENL